MVDFRRSYTQLTTDMDDSMQSAREYRALRDRIVTINGNKTGGASLPVLTLRATPSPLNFVAVPVRTARTANLTLTNTSTTGPVTVSVGTLAAPFTIMSGGGSFSLAKGQSRTITVRYLPATTVALSSRAMLATASDCREPSTRSTSMTSSGHTTRSTGGCTRALARSCASKTWVGSP